MSVCSRVSYSRTAESSSFYRKSDFRQITFSETRLYTPAYLYGTGALRSCSSAEYPFEVSCEFLVGSGAVAGELLDVLARKVAVALAVGLGILDQNLGPPL